MYRSRSARPQNFCCRQQNDHPWSWHVGTRLRTTTQPHGGLRVATAMGVPGQDVTLVDTAAALRGIASELLVPLLLCAFLAVFRLLKRRPTPPGLREVSRRR